MAKLVGLGLLAALAILGFRGVSYYQVYTRANQDFAAAVQKLELERKEIRDTRERENQVELDQLRLRHERMLGDVNLLTGRAAQVEHQKEWERRFSKDPLLEEGMSEVFVQGRQLTGDPQKASIRAALGREAVKLLPSGSRVQVVRERGRWGVKLAFVLPEDHPTRNKHATTHQTPAALREAIREFSARVMQDILTGDNGVHVSSLTLSCNLLCSTSLIPKAATPEERRAILDSVTPRMDLLYRVRLDVPQPSGTSTDIRTMPHSKLVTQMQVLVDGTESLTLHTEPRADGGRKPIDLQLKF